MFNTEAPAEDTRRVRVGRRVGIAADARRPAAAGVVARQASAQQNASVRASASADAEALAAQEASAKRPRASDNAEARRRSSRACSNDGAPWPASPRDRRTYVPEYAIRSARGRASGGEASRPGAVERDFDFTRGVDYEISKKGSRGGVLYDFEQTPPAMVAPRRPRAAGGPRTRGPITDHARPLMLVVLFVSEQPRTAQKDAGGSGHESPRADRDVMVVRVLVNEWRCRRRRARTSSPPACARDGRRVMDRPRGHPEDAASAGLAGRGRDNVLRGSIDARHRVRYPSAPPAAGAHLLDRARHRNCGRQGGRPSAACWPPS